VFSWELSQQRASSCLIGIYAPPVGVSIDFALSFSALVKPALHDIIRVSGLPFGEARTQMAYQCLNGGYQFLFMIDVDILAPPETIPKLMSYRLPIVSGLYHQRFPSWDGMTANYLPCMFNEVRQPDGTFAKQAITNYTPGSLVNADLVPGGCLLIHRSVFDRFLANGIKRFFQWTLTAEEPQGKSEDFFFTTKARELGYQPMVDTSLIATHETHAQVTAKGLLPKL